MMRGDHIAEVAGLLLERELCTTAVPSSGSTISTDQGKVYVKVRTGGSSADAQLMEYEAVGLKHLHDAATILRIPRPWLWGTLKNGNGFYVMDHVDMRGPKNRGQFMRTLGEGLAEIHLAKPQHSAFGFPLDGCCGACPQENNAEGRVMNWVDFWREYRLGSQLRMLRQKQPGDQLIQQKGAELMARLGELFIMLVVEDITPSLLHGDLWSGNVCADENGRPVIFDPAPYYGHSEADLGIARMFGGFTADFFEAYHAKIPKADGFERRSALYELHHHLNHYNIFGSGYRSGALALMNDILQK